MANIYELGINREVIEEIAKDIPLTLGSGIRGSIVDNLLKIIERPTTYQHALIDGKPGFYIRVGKIVTERFEGEGLHVFTHSGSEGFLDIEEFDRRLRLSLDRQKVIWTDHSKQECK